MGRHRDGALTRQSHTQCACNYSLDRHFNRVKTRLKLGCSNVRQGSDLSQEARGMPSEIQGFAAALCRTGEFEGVSPDALQAILDRSDAALDMRLINTGIDEPIIRSGADFTHLVFVQQGTVLPWQFPSSDLRYPFLIGGHELLMESTKWMATYSATRDAVIIEVPVGIFQKITTEIPIVRQNIERLVLRRLSRFYWTSLSITGTPQARVAAALISRLALRGEDWGKNRDVEIRQTELMRLTVLSRTAAADGTRQLETRDLIQTGGGRYFSGRVTIPDVDALKNAAFSDIKEAMRLRHESSSLEPDK